MTQPLTEEQVRLQRLETLRAHGLDPYPSTVKRTHTIGSARAMAMGTRVCITGRLILRRDMGKLSFAHLKDETGKLQLAFSEKELGRESYQLYSRQFDVGDFLEAEGELFTTKIGELTVMVKNYRLLAKSLLPLPEKFHGLADVELRYRQRYLDLIANEASMQIARLRSVVVREIRKYFDHRGFYEVETPVLQAVYGGANARPFVTHHHALDMQLYLRIAPELYLKRLIVGGFEKVYEIGKCFRNEGVDQNHNPEFTMIEFYWAYANYNDLMELVEDFMPTIIQAAGLPLRFRVGGKEVDFTPPYPRVTMRDLIKQYANLDIEDYPDEASLFKKAKALRVAQIKPGMGRGALIDDIYKHFVRPHIINPSFVIDHPVELSPLAKRKADDPRYVERLQLLCVGDNELCNGFTELNDPLDQKSRFKEQVALGRAGNEESMPYDEDYITALKHGMPPTAGLGMGIDRLVKLFTNAPNLKEVILFSTLRPEKTTAPQPKIKVPKKK